MDILLTPEEQENAANRGPDDDWTNICRAQLKKVVEWVKKNNCAPLQAQGTRTYAAHLVLPKESWQALKDAAGEGK